MQTDEIGKRVKKLRTEGKITQEQLAQYLGVDQSLVTKLENGTRNFNVTMIDKICNLFGCSEEYLLGESDSYIPLLFSFRSNGIELEDLEGIATMNKIAMNIQYMNRLTGDD
ncbi:MAG: helix-turn-helix transcriptional regulator [Holdemanella sp.]|nr:helix-turn-helix transcriptional regulator [Holdemanella sp.]